MARPSPARQALWYARSTVDAAYVSERDEIAFIGRVNARGKDGNLGFGAEACGRAIAEALLDD